MNNEGAPSEFEGRLSPGRDWREIVAWVGDLPPMPHVASRAISMIENPDTTAQEMTELLQSDTALAARVLKIANSAMFSRQREITTLSQAIMVIGFKALKGVIVAATLRQLNKNFGKIEKLIWEHSMSVAVSSTVITKRLKKNFVEEIFLLGLLHSLGQIVILSQPDTAKDFKQVLKMIETEGKTYVDAETKILGFAHPLIGALVAKKWNFSAETCQIILHYADPLEGDKPETDMDCKVAIVQMADAISHSAQIGSPTKYPSRQEALERAALYAGFEKATLNDTLQELVDSTKKQFESESHIYS